MLTGQVKFQGAVREIYVFYIEKLRQPRRKNALVIHKYGSKTLRPVDKYVALLEDIIYKYRMGDRVRFKKLKPKHQDLVVLLALAGDITDSDYFDLHAGNVMCRGRRFVVIDPLAG